jgi:hypothetical protein
VGPDDPPFGLEHTEILPDRDCGDAEPRREASDERPAVLFDNPGDVLLALAREHLLVIARFLPAFELGASGRTRD